MKSTLQIHADTYQSNLDQGLQQKQLSKEFVRQWLIDHDFQGKEGQTLPDMPDTFIEEVSERYIELFEHITGDPFQREDLNDVHARIEKNILSFLNKG